MMDAFGDLVRDLVRDQPLTRDRPWRLVRATVSATAPAATPPTVDVELAGGGTVPSLRYPKASDPDVGDGCWVAVRGNSAQFVLMIMA